MKRTAQELILQPQVFIYRRTRWRMVIDRV